MQPSFRTDERGTSAVEFALLSPLFLLVLFGMIAYGIYFGASHSLQQIAADAARTAIAGLDQKERQLLVSNFVDRNAKGYPFIDPLKLTVVAADNAADGSEFMVSLRYDARDLRCRCRSARKIEIESRAGRNSGRALRASAPA